MKLKYLYFTSLLFIVGIFFTASSTNNAGEDMPSNKDIIKFSHQFHLEMTDCETCHSAVVESTSLEGHFMPNHDNCGECHDVEDDCSKCHIDDRYEPLVQPESDIIFNHKFHLEEADVKCTDCHKGFDSVDYSSELASPNPVMANCYSCHNDEGIAPDACEACHISTANLIPQTHKSANFITAHKFQAIAADANCVMCHDNNNNSCQECHVATTAITEQNTASDFFQPYEPSNFIDGAKRQQITRVHEMNYRFLHGIDAKGKTAECRNCHEVETFCANCHQADNSDFALSGIVPASHLKANFFTIGVGTGGGEHATLARRDIESCAACHDTNGADPTCITCHLDSDGVKGTNPKTHPANFMSDVEGDWHNSAGSICFNCHTASSPESPAGIGFCGYCHGSIH